VRDQTIAARDEANAAVDEAANINAKKDAE